MELAVADPGYDHPDVDGNAALAETERAARELFPEVARRSANIGAGADFPVEILTLGGLFFLGDQIKKNLDAWLDLAKRFARFLQRHGVGYRLDPVGADLIVLDEILQRFPEVASVDRLFETEVVARELRFNPDGSLERTPERLYVRGFRVNGRSVVIAGLGSSGVLAFWHQYDDELKMILGKEDPRASER